MIESYILCEGYHDRAFWDGLLLHLGCTPPGVRPDGSRVPIPDPWGTIVRGPEYAYRSATGGFIRVVPAGGISKILPLARNRLIQRAQKRLNKLIINVDLDLNADGTPATTGIVTQASVEHLAHEFDPAAIVTANQSIVIDGGATTVAFTRWEAPDSPSAGLPNQHTLERILCAAIAAAYPVRGPAVAAWLDSRPAAPPAGPKEHSFSYLAGWYARLGSYEAFCSTLWHDPLVAVQLRDRLQACGVWQLAADIAR